MVFGSLMILKHSPPDVRESREADADRVKTRSRICLRLWKLLSGLVREVPDVTAEMGV